ncbi:MAG: hypothetical protein V7640_2808, partial [Betaproteobacteria bacterium]
IRFLNWILILLMSPAALAAEDMPRPPCGTAPNPPYAAFGAQPNVRVWNGGSRTIRVTARCNESAADFKIVVPLSGTLRFDGSADKLLERIGAVSAMQGIRYWSVTDKRWRVLITKSAAVDGPTAAQQRADFDVTELKQGKDLFFAQRDSRSTGQVVYRMRVLEAAQDRVVVETENVSPVRTYVFTLFKPGELRTVHFLTRPSAGIWNYYLLTAIGAKQSASHEASLINRAAALYRYVAGQPTDEEPPVAP